MLSVTILSEMRVIFHHRVAHCYLEVLDDFEKYKYLNLLVLKLSCSSLSLNVKDIIFLEFDDKKKLLYFLILLG